MAKIIGCSNKILEVDLQKKTITTYMVPEALRRQYLGAKGLG